MFVHINGKGHNIRNGIVWVQTGNSTSTCTVSLHVVEPRTYQKLESLKKIFRDDENRIRICQIIPKTTEIIRIYFGRQSVVFVGVLSVVCCAVFVVKHPKKDKKGEQKSGQTQKNRNCLNTDSVFDAIWSTMVQKRSENGNFSQTHCFHISPGIGRRFRPKVLFQTPQKALFYPRSCSKGPSHALEKVLSSETPNIFVGFF